MDLSQQLITLNEASRAMPYQDSRGIWTVGIGHNLEANGLPAGVCAEATAAMPYPECLGFIEDRGGLTETEIEKLFGLDLTANCYWLWAKPWWAGIAEARKAALNDFAFNLGPVTAGTFTTFLGLCAVGDWDAAAQDLGSNHKLVAEEPKRIARAQQIIRSGSVAGIL